MRDGKDLRLDRDEDGRGDRVFQLLPLSAAPCIAALDEETKKKESEVSWELGGSRLGTRSGREITRTVPCVQKYTSQLCLVGSNYKFDLHSNEKMTRRIIKNA